ncbi:hypothetical protein AUJ42_02100 [Candidatus Collierbacteria bacterium CG1_02_44_10]|uniref:Polymerase nucleotidyl transferase domain-containing protein n=4 Tax=Candidatus Collieribacteriota TaxID=1752725 RepID=A0A2H0DUP5_9BACT|nr:nucleotidyltransferase domain-containing protein [bacterium]OIN91177.1 MAG: hypothetical protein AUJ42_02100 [Candidatus Collierbacteria bacterium CG1_02_44_10]PIP85882.1 MAG: hypothetical protein COW83_01895 [Candidatus Collierbacteria bacterium CG22_combo_CG10-13_8_21_14_all_43_12]PIR99357.1 MAG: hypothetical protein COT86_04445 [Candidatus Collierbacteria bacterium CG10_big_fil_rev_8_21_14_0_10_43_36]PIZ24907.1 MAG: hypothetical protein COY48_00410 [Candidatus Collierbacteria bacterium CG
MDLRRAVSVTIKYAGFFNFPLSEQEIYYWLTTSRSASKEQLKPYLPGPLSTKEKKLRLEVFQSSQHKISHAKNLIRILRYVPGLRLVALTGSVAAGNSHPDDDIDLLFITSPHCLWLLRPLVILLISVFFRRRHPGEDHSKASDAFCPNLWLDSLSVSIPKNKRNLYTAHEVLQTIPLLDRGDTYQTFLYANRWTKRYLANAYQSSLLPVRPLAEVSYPSRGSLIPEGVNPRHRGSHSCFSYVYFLFAPLNYLFFIIQLLYMTPKKTSEVVHLHAAFLHTTDFAGAISHHLKTP